MKSVMLAIALFGWMAPTAARAEKVKLDVKVVEASQQGNAIDPKVVHLQRDLKHIGVGFTSYKLVSEASPVVDDKATTEVGLPNGKTLKLTPDGRENGMIKMKLEIPGVIQQGYSTSPKGGRYTLVAGSKDHGKPEESQIIVVITHTAQ